MRLALLICLAAGAVLAVAAWRARPLTLARGLSHLDAPEATRLTALVREAGIDPARVRLVESDGPCDRVRVSSLARWLGLGRATRSGCVGVRQRQVTSVSLSGAALLDLVPLAGLASLRHVRLRKGRLVSVQAPEACVWQSLDVARNRVEAVGDLSRCADLTSLDVSENRLRALPTLPKPLIRLDASGNPLADLAPLAEGSLLTDLALRDTPLTRLDRLPPLPMLERLDLARTAISHLDAGVLARWPRLSWLGLGATPLAETSGTFEWSGDSSSLSLGVLTVGVSGTPLAEAFHANVLAMHDGRQRHSVADLPRGSGRWQNARRRGQVETGLRSRIDARGEAAWMTGARSVVFRVDRGIVVEVTASVEVGRLRIYLREGDGYTYAEALPGVPLRLTGPLITGTEGYLFFLEAVGGRASGIRWSVRGG